MLDAVADYRAEIRRLASQAISAQEQERKRVARELHDETAQSLTALLVRLRIAERSDSVDEMRAALGDLRLLTVQTLDEVRNLSLVCARARSTTSASFRRCGGIPDDTPITTPFPVSLDAQNLDVRLDPTIELVLYRVVQEALTNAAKHAKPTRIAVALSRDSAAVSGRVTDDGRGFDVDAYLGRTGNESRGLGIFGMRERLALVGGSLVVTSRPASGRRSRSEFRSR